MRSKSDQSPAVIFAHRSTVRARQEHPLAPAAKLGTRLFTGPRVSADVTPHKPGPIPLAAPGLIGPVSILKQPTDGLRSSRRRRNRPYRHVHLEVDLAVERKEAREPSFWAKWEDVLSQRDIVESSDLVVLTLGTLHAVAALRFRRVDHWEISPGGWLPPPTTHATGGSIGEPVGLLLEALDHDTGTAFVQARSFSIRLSDRGGNHIDAVVRRVHRARRHSISLDLWGVWTRAGVSDLKGALAARLPVARTLQTKFMYA